jgi:hypothetical protein
MSIYLARDSTQPDPGLEHVRLKRRRRSWARTSKQKQKHALQVRELRGIDVMIPNWSLATNKQLTHTAADASWRRETLLIELWSG